MMIYCKLCSRDYFDGILNVYACYLLSWVMLLKCTTGRVLECVMLRTLFSPRRAYLRLQVLQGP